MLSGLTEEQKTKLIIISPYNKIHKILNFDKIIACYIHNTDDLFKYQNFNNKPGCCACVIKIINAFIIKNINTNNVNIICSECIKWWISEKDIRYIKEIIKCLLNNIECHPSTLRYILPTVCHFCKSSRDCINCKNKKNIKNIFTKWRIYSNMKITNLITDLKSTVSFGKYKTQTCYKLC